MFTTSDCDIDPRSIEEFNRALDEYADFRNKRDGKGYDYALNRSAKDVAAWAAHYTIRADKGALQTLLSDPQTAAKILSARFSKAGKKRPSGKAWAALVAYFRSHTPKTSAFMASGWLPAFRTLRAYAKEPTSGIDLRRAFGRRNEVIPTKNSYGPLGEGIPARPVSGGIAVEIANMSVNPRNRTSADALVKYGQTALDEALRTKAADMMGFMGLLEQAHDRKADVYNGAI